MSKKHARQIRKNAKTQSLLAVPITPPPPADLLTIDQLGRQDERRNIQKHELPFILEVQALMRAITVVLELAEFGDKERLPAALNRFIPIIGARSASIWSMLQSPRLAGYKNKMWPYLADWCEDILTGIQLVKDGDNGAYLRSLPPLDEIAAVELHIEQFTTSYPREPKRGRRAGIDKVTTYVGKWIHNNQMEGQTVQQAIEALRANIESKPANLRSPTERAIFNSIQIEDAFSWAYQAYQRYEATLPENKQFTYQKSRIVDK